MNDNRKRVLDLLAAGKIDAAEADRLLSVLEAGNGPEESTRDAGQRPRSIGSAKYLCVRTTPKEGAPSDTEAVNVRIPILLVRAGMKLGSIIPESGYAALSANLGQHGIDLDLDSLNKNGIGALVDALSSSSIDIDTEHEKVRIYCE